jgi:hypothetical protein
MVECSTHGLSLAAQLQHCARTARSSTDGQNSTCLLCCGFSGVRSLAIDIKPNQGLKHCCAAALQAYVWPLPQGKPWPCLPVRLYKAKRVMRMVLVNPGQSNMLLTGELISKDCTGSQLLHATPAHTQAEMRRNRRRAAAAAARRSTGLQHTGQLEQGFWQQQQQQQQQEQPQFTTRTSGVSDSDSGTCGAVSQLQQLLAGLTAGDAASDLQDSLQQEQQQVQRQVQQQQSTQVAGEELLHAVQQAREQEVMMPQQQQAPGSSPDSTTFLQRIGASLWSRSSSSRRQSTSNDAAAAAVSATSAPSELRVTSAAAAVDLNSGVGALAASIQQLLAAMRELAAVVAASKLDNDIEPTSRSGAAAAAAAARQDQLLQVVTQLQQHHLCSAEESSELLATLHSIACAGDALLQMPGFDSQWGLDVAGSDAALQRCARPAAGARGLPHAPVAVDAMLAAAAAQQAVSQGCHAVQAAADELNASRCDSTAAAAAAAAEAAVKLVQQLMQDLPPFVASIPALHSQQQQQQQQQGTEQSIRPCLAVLRIWRLHAQLHCGCSTPQQLAPEQQQLVLPFVVLCSERSVGVSPCGRLLVAVVAVQPASSSSSSAAQCLEQLEASAEEFHQVRPSRQHMGFYVAVSTTPYVEVNRVVRRMLVE